MTQLSTRLGGKNGVPAVIGKVNTGIGNRQMWYGELRGNVGNAAFFAQPTPEGLASLFERLDSAARRRRMYLVRDAS